jgi:hypothetical protein
MNKERSASDLKVEGRSLMFFMYVERQKWLSVNARRRCRRRRLGFHLLGGRHAVDGKKEFGNEWEVDGSKVEAFLR